MKRVVVNDTNVFIDLYSVGLMEEFFTLPWEIHTTELVMLELLREGQLETISRYKADGRLHVPILDAKAMEAVVGMQLQFINKTNVSVTDCSVWYYAKQNGYVLLTGDRKLRKVSVLDGVEVHGILHVFDSLVDNGIITTVNAAKKLRQLYSINSRLPQEAIDERLKKWEANNDEEESL